MFACFNRAYKGTDTSINDFLLDVFRCAKSESKVFGSFYLFSLNSFAEDLISLVGKKSSHALDFDFVGGCAEYELNSDVVKAIRNLKGSCSLYNADPDGLMNHNKFFVFESVNFVKLREIQPNSCTASVPSDNGRALYLASANITKRSGRLDPACYDGEANCSDQKLSLHGWRLVLGNPGREHQSGPNAGRGGARRIGRRGGRPGAAA